MIRYVTVAQWTCFQCDAHGYAPTLDEAAAALGQHADEAH